MNTYKRIGDEECAAAREYSKRTKCTGPGVRKTWIDYMADHDIIRLKTKVEGKMLHEYLMSLETEFAEGKIKPEEIDKKVSESISGFTVN